MLGIYPEAVGIDFADLFVQVVHTLFIDIDPVQYIAVFIAPEAQCAIRSIPLTGGGVGTLHHSVDLVAGGILHVDDAVLFIGIRSVHSVACQELGRLSDLLVGIGIPVQPIQIRLAPLVSATAVAAGAGCGAVEQVVAQRAQTCGKLCVFDANLASMARLTVNRCGVVFIHGLAVGADTLESHMPASFLLGLVTIAVTVFIIGVLCRGGMGCCLGDKSRSIAGDTLAHFYGVQIQRDRAINYIAAAAGELCSAGTAIAFQQQIAGIFVKFQLLHAVSLVARITEQLVLVEEFLFFRIIHGQQIFGKGNQVVFRNVVKVIYQEDKVFVIVTLGVAVGAIGDDHKAFVAGGDIHITVAVGIIALAGQSAEGDAVDTAGTVTVTHGRLRIIMLTCGQFVDKIVANLRNIQSVHHTGVSVVHKALDLITVKYADIPALRGLVFQRTVDFTFIVANITDVCATGNGTCSQALHHTHDLAGLHIGLHQKVSKGCVEILAFVVTAETLQVTRAIFACCVIDRGIPLAQIQFILTVGQDLICQRILRNLRQEFIGSCRVRFHGEGRRQRQAQHQRQH